MASLPLEQQELSKKTNTLLAFIPLKKQQKPFSLIFEKHLNINTNLSSNFSFLFLICTFFQIESLTTSFLQTNSFTNTMKAIFVLFALVAIATASLAPLRTTAPSVTNVSYCFIICKLRILFKIRKDSEI